MCVYMQYVNYEAMQWHLGQRSTQQGNICIIVVKLPDSVNTLT